MGGSVSSGRDNDELVDNLVSGNFIRTRAVERVFRALNREDYMTGDLDRAYKDLAWRSGPLHLSAPCIYSEVMEGLELKPGLTFLNIGSGTGYFSTMVGLILGSSGISHGVEVNEVVLNYANRKLSHFKENSFALGEFDFCEPKFYLGNGLCISDLPGLYDRVYCGAGCPEKYQEYFKQLIKVGGILVLPVEDKLLQMRRVSETEWVTKSLLNVSFATLFIPTDSEEPAATLKLDEQAPPKLQLLTRSAIRRAIRSRVLRIIPELQDPRGPPPPKHSPRRICIPIDEYRYFERFTALHGLDREGGAQEVNSLLSLVLNLGNNRHELSSYGLASDSDVSSYLGDEEVDSDGNEDVPDSDDQNVEASESSDEGDDGDGGRGAGTVRPNFACHVLLNRMAPSVTVAQNSDGNPTNDSTITENNDDSSDNDLEDLLMSAAHLNAAGSSRDVPMESESETKDSEHSEGKRPASRETAESGGQNTEEPKQSKRQKLDSGIGEENTPTSEGTPHSSPDSSNRSNTVVEALIGKDGLNSLSSRTEDAASRVSRASSESRASRASRGSRRSRGSRGSLGSRELRGSRGSRGSRSPVRRRERSTSSEHDSPCRPPRLPPRPPIKRHASEPDSEDRNAIARSLRARRARLSAAMEHAVAELPLPRRLKWYVNLDRIVHANDVD